MVLELNLCKKRQKSIERVSKLSFYEPTLYLPSKLKLFTLRQFVFSYFGELRKAFVFKQIAPKEIGILFVRSLLASD